MSAETVASAEIDFELSGARSGGCKETVDVRAKRRSESAWRFCYARRKVRRSDHVVGNIKVDVQHHRSANPDSAGASPIGTEFELSGVRSGGRKENTDIRAKRKSQNTCRFYYVRSKRMHSQNSAPRFTSLLRAKSHESSEDFVYGHLIRSHKLVQDTKMGIQHHRNGLNRGITEASEQNDSIRKDYYISHPGEFPLVKVKQSGKSDGDHAFEQGNAHDRSTIGEDCADFRNCFIPGISGAPTAPLDSNSYHNLSRTTEEILAQELLSASPGDKRNALHNKLDSLNISSSNHDEIAISGQVLPDKLTHGQVHASVATSANDHIDLSNCVLNMACEIDLHEGEGYSGSLHGHAVNHHGVGHNGDVLLLARDPKLNREMCLGGQDFTFSATAVVSDMSEPAQCREYIFNSLEVDESSIHDLGEISDEMMVCSLNREDPHIPWHDDLASSTVPFSSVTCQSHKDSQSDASSPANNESKEEISLLKTEENPPKTSINYQSVEQHKLPDEGSNKLPASCGIKTVFPNIASAIVVTREEIDAPAETSPPYREPEDQNSTERSLTGKSLKECNPTDNLSDGECSSLSVFHELDSSLSRFVDEECESDYDDSKLTEIWEMIHSMDFYPGDRDSHVNGEVFRYRHGDKRESAIRLERCAGSFIQQAIASGGPLAILYGQNSKHYIRKDEVVLGRETEDFQVDIDLGRGGTNKISRRQALIKLERDGTFFLKNLGRSSIYVNGTAVSGGNHINLTANCLIEVKGMKLSFGINERSVRHHLAKLAKESRGANRNFEWSPEGYLSNTV
ncbi:uncharacterized protein LOC115686010 isoform X2 [Syzygium oleosum]|uniref:uncharacterized protein LOC115686010 isoform X2 n=1 Tax=Syzygium oleosum TaxID=219896 RepID=UPI0024BA24A2|nr:uncharacterized protein LOC115686010 isoform X2 [Syzygium oleosum]